MTSLRCDLRAPERILGSYVALDIPKRCAVTAHRLYWDCLSIPMVFHLDLKSTLGIRLKGLLSLILSNACARNSKYGALFSWPIADFFPRKIWSISAPTAGMKKRVNSLSG